MNRPRRYAPFVAAAGIALLAGVVAANVLLKDDHELVVVAGQTSVSTSTSPAPEAAPGKTVVKKASAENVSPEAGSGNGFPGEGGESEATTSVLGVDEVPVKKVPIDEYMPLVESFPVPIEASECDPDGTYQEVANCYLAEAVEVDEEINALQEEQYYAVSSEKRRRELREDNQAWLDERRAQVDEIGLDSTRPEDEAIIKSAQLFLKISEQRLAALEPA